MSKELVGIVLQSLRAIARDDLTSEDEVVDALVLEGVNRITAEKLLALVPLALGRVLVSKLGITDFPPVFNLRMEHGSYAVLPIADEKIYQCAMRIGEDLVVNGPRRLFEAAAPCSAEVRALRSTTESMFAASKSSSRSCID